MEVSQNHLLAKFETLEQVLTEIRIFLSKTEDNAVNEESRKQDLEIIVDSLQKENKALKRDVDQLHVTLTDMKVSKDYLLEKFKALEQELEESPILLSKKDEDVIKVKQDVKTTVVSLQKENRALKYEVDDISNKAELEKKDLLQKKNEALRGKVDENTKKAKLAKKDHQTIVDLKKENKALKSKVNEIAKQAKLAKRDQQTTMDSLQKENKALKCEVDEIAKKAELAKKNHKNTVDYLKKENRALKCKVDEIAKKAELSKKNHKDTVDSLQKENEALKCEVDEISNKAESAAKKELITTVDLQKENKALKCEIEEIASKAELEKDLLQKKNEALRGEVNENTKKAELAKKDHQTTVDSLQKENKALKCEVDEIAKKAELAKKNHKDTVDSLQKENEALKCEVDEITNKAELEKKDLKTSVDTLQEENKALKCEIDINANKAQMAMVDLKESMDRLQLENEKLECKIDQYISHINTLKSEKLSCEQKIHSLSLEKAEICRKLEVSKVEIEQIRSKSNAFEHHFSAENVKKLIAQVNVFMDNGHIDSAISTFTSYVFDANLINNFNLVHIFNKIYRIKEQLKSFEEQLLHSDSCSLVTLSYNDLKNNIDYPNLILNAEKKFLIFCRDHSFHITAFSLCDTLIRIRQCKDAWVYFEQGELLFRRGNYHGAREAFFYSLKFSKEGDSDLQLRYDQACKALQLQICTNIWTLFNSDGTPLEEKGLNSKYKELMRYYHPDKQYGFVKQYQDAAEYMSKELTQAYRTLSAEVFIYNIS